MKLHEFQAKELLSRYGVAIPRGMLADDGGDAEKVARRLGAGRVVVKAQVQAGARGPFGGVRFADGPAAARAAAGDLIGRRLVTSQTGPHGRLVRWVYVEEAVAHARSLYLAVTIDRSAGRAAVLASAEGGDDIEERALRGPAGLHRLHLTFAGGRLNGDFEALAHRVGLGADTALAFAALVRGLVRAFVELDASLIEINPLALADDGRLIALDAKMTIDDNALFRHRDLATMRDLSDEEESDPLELEAQRYQVNYVRMGGDIGVMANGAGLALATLDLLAEAGGRPANFMDIRTTATSRDIAFGYDLIAANPRTRAVLVNVHGGGMQPCDTVADGIAMAMRRARRPLPIVARLAGNNADFARVRLANYGIRFTESADMRDAARRAVALARPEAA